MWTILSIFAVFLMAVSGDAVQYENNVLNVRMHQLKDSIGTDHVRMHQLKDSIGTDHGAKTHENVHQAAKLSSTHLKRKQEVANQNLRLPSPENLKSKSFRDAPIVELDPGQPAKPFSLPTLKGSLVYPGPIINQTVPVLFQTFNPLSGFTQCLWNCSGSLEELVKNSPNDTHYVFMSTSNDAYSDALWMQHRFKTVMMNLVTANSISSLRAESLESRIHFVTLPVTELGNWIPLALHQWMCLDHNCGLDQIRIESPSIQASLHRPLVVPRLDARYDWLPSCSSVFGNKSLAAIFVGDGCHREVAAKDKVAVVTDGGCSYFDKVQAMQQSGSLGVIVMTQASVQDMNCADQECQTPLKIPATSMLYNDMVKSAGNMTVHFQTTPTDNFFLGINSEGKLAQAGWFLYPSMSFLVYQAQWFEYEHKLQERVQEESASVITVLSAAEMHGRPGAQVMLSLPSQKELSQYARMELDLSLSCPGEDDEACPPWDHTVQLKVTRRKGTVNMEMGRWITPFRRRIGRWISDVTPLVPLLDPALTTFTLNTAPWAKTWVPSLNLRLSGKRQPGDLYPYKTDVLYSGDSFTFDKHYNSHFKPLTKFQPPADAKKVEIYSVITGHGSDENGCGEFCVTSHHFSVNGKNHSISFDNAGSPLGCADHVPQGVTPNEHGTWLYGRDGWCDGQDVKPWIVDISADLRPGAANNTITYHGLFNGTDPDPKHSPGIMIVHAYLVYYKPL